MTASANFWSQIQMTEISIFIKCFSNSILLSGPNRFSVRPSYLSSLALLFLLHIRTASPYLLFNFGTFYSFLAGLVWTKFDSTHLESFPWLWNSSDSNYTLIFFIYRFVFKAQRNYFGSHNLYQIPSSW